MQRLRNRSGAESRRGVVLIVVLALLTLFAMVGITFVFYSQNQARSSHHFSDSWQVGYVGDVPDKILTDDFFRQLLYDCPDSLSGIDSSMRGHSLIRLLYGLNDESLNTTAFNGVGRLHFNSPIAGVDDYYLVNYRYFPQDGFIRDPERIGWRTDPKGVRGPYTGGFNVPYTYPDLNNFALAAVKADGTVLLPSFHRPWLFNPGRALNDPTNPNWSNQVGKYLTLRPRPADMGPGFPYPEASTGDVNNLGGPGGNDSIWIDIGFPVMQGRDGTKFKPLFAPLVIDLDGRVDLNVHGNIRGRDGSGRPIHVSNQGWGPWEVNLQYVLDWQSGGVYEWPNLFLGARGKPGRYGVDSQPGAVGGQAARNNLLHVYAQADLDACRTGSVPTGRPFDLPGRTAPLSAFPSFPTGFDNASSAERWAHPLLFNAYSGSADDRQFNAAELADLLLRSPVRSDAGIEYLCPNNFASQRARGLVTTHSVDIDSPGMSPWMFDPRQSPYGFAPGDRAPSGAAAAFPPLALRRGSVPEDSEFAVPLLPPGAPASDWRSRIAAQGRIDLNHPLTPYPLPEPQTADVSGARFDVPARMSQFLQAQQERQQMANEIYTRLLAVTGVPRSAKVPNKPTTEELHVRRWLAQLAVNMVDFIDEDDISTPFNFYTASDAQFAPDFDPGELTQTGVPPAGNPFLPRYWVFGTELPRVVLNEALAEYKDPAPGDPAGLSTVRVFVELHNPLPAPPSGQPLQPQDGFPVRLCSDAAADSVTGKTDVYAPFMLTLTRPLSPRAEDDDVLGMAAAAEVGVLQTPPDFKQPVRQVDGNPQPLPSPSIRPGGYFLLGPLGTDARDTIKAPPGGTVPAATPWLQLRKLEYQRAFDPAKPDEKSAGLTVLLQRLANPHIPYDEQPSVTDANGDRQPNPWYNPYVTVDTLPGVPLRNSDDNSPYAARGKRQPYAGHPEQLADQISPDMAQKTQHTFGLANNPAPTAGRYDWLVHLDRELIGVPELLHVSACQPHQLTQRFIEGGRSSGEKKFQHLASWFDQSRRLYRTLELFTIHGRGLGAPNTPGGRMFGKINLNTIWDAETFLALCDPQAANGANFNRDTVLAIYNRLLASRSPGLVSGQGLGPVDRPFQGLGTGWSQPDGPGNPDAQHPRAAGINDTLLRADAADADGQPGGGGNLPRLFQVPGEDHPYKQQELLTKIFSNGTTRSNVFAVWVTVGFFEVTDATTMPPKLGAEITRGSGNWVRRRFFAIIDRSRLTQDTPPGSSFNARNDGAILHLRSLD